MSIRARIVVAVALHKKNGRYGLPTVPARSYGT